MKMEAMDSVSEIPNKRHKASTNIDMDFRNLFSNVIKSLYDADILCNVTLIAGNNGQRVSVHRLILAAASTYFRARFTTDLKADGPTELLIPDIHSDHLKIIIDFYYSGVIDINERNIFDLFKMAVQLEFVYVEQKCYQFLTERLSVANCLSVWTSLETLNKYEDFVQSAFKIAKYDFVELTSQAEFLQLDFDHLMKLLQCEDLNVYSEEETFYAMVKWVNHDEKGRRRHIKELLTIIRLTALKSEFLYEDVTGFCRKFSCSNLIKDVYKWKYVPKSQPKPILPRATTVSKRFIAIGNADSAKDVRITEIFNPVTKQWSTFKNFTCEQIGFCSVILEDDLYVLGGGCSSDQNVVKTVQKFNFSTKELTNVADMTTKRVFFGAAVLNNHIYVAGGCNLSSVERYDKSSDTWFEMPPMLEKRRDFSLISMSGKLFAVGGLQVINEEASYLNSVESYDPLENQWKFRAPMNRKRCSHGLFAYKDRLYAIGGMCGPVEPSVEFYDPMINKWTVIEILSVPRVAFGLVCVDDYIIVAGGGRLRGVFETSAIKIDLKTYNKEDIAPMQVNRAHFNLLEVPRYNFNV